MQNIYLEDIDFHTASESEQRELRSFQRRHNFQCWIKRFLIITIAFIIIVVFQIIARQDNSPLFVHYNPVKQLLLYSVLAFLGINVLSYLQLLFQSYILFRIKTTKITKLTVKRKIVVDDIMKYTNIRIKFKYLTCQLADGTFIMNRIWVHGPISFSCIKEGQSIYVRAVEKSDRTQYYYVA